MAKWIVLALLALSAVPDAFTDSPRQCSQGCKNAPPHNFKFNIEPGHTYVYNFEATTETSVPGAAATSEDEKAGGHKKPGGQRLHITAQAELSAGPSCDHTMRLINVEVTGADGKKFNDFTSCENHPVGFSFNNGLLGDELCAEPDDTPSNLNVKRAVLSLLQVARIEKSGSAFYHETDVFGTCPTDFTYHEDNGVLKVTKRRNLNRCAHREGLKNTFLSSAYVGSSSFQSSPLLQSSLQVEQTLKDNLLVSAVGQEDYLLRTFSNGAAGAHTTVTTKLTLVNHQPGPAATVTAGQAKPILFDAHNWNYGGVNPEEHASADQIAFALKNAEKEAAGGTSLESAGKFRKLIRVMRYASAETLTAVYGQVKAGTGYSNKKVARNLFQDALLQTGTGQAIEVVVQLLNSKDLPPAVAKLYFLGFSFVRHATLGSLKAVATLLETPDLPPEALLGSGALLGRYCSEHQCDESVPEFKVLVGKLAHKLGKGCKPVSRVHENEMVGALKGLLNARKLTTEAVESVLKCAVSNNVPTRIRVAALDTFRGDACQPKLKKTAMDMMKNTDLDSELRIKAYLALTECPCEHVAHAVKEMMDTESVNQVGAFVSSHLLALRTSSNSDHADAKHHLAGIRPKKRYPFDIRKFSRAFEVSYALDGLNMGSSAEGNLIFSQKSFVPRSAMVNLTTELFGHSFNLMELGVRAENVDHVLESLMGPKGYFKTHSPNEVANEGHETFNSFLKLVKDRLKKTRGGKSGKRGKRGVTREMVDAFGKKVGHSVDHDDHSLDLDFNMKLFGSEVSWMNYHGNLQELQPDFLVNKFFDGVDEGINKAKDFKMDFSPNIAFLDTELVYPTGAGFDLKLVATAHSSVDLKVESNLDLPAIFKDPGNAKFHVKLVPSATIEVTGTMLVNAFSSVMAGLEVVGTAHSSTGLDIEAHLLENGHGIDVKLGLPKAKQEFFNVRTEVLSKRREKGSPSVSSPLKFDRNRKDYHGCFDQLTPLTGLVVCGDVGFPWDGLTSVVVPKTNRAMFPLDGPFKASFHIEKDDETLTHYHFRALYANKGPHKQSLEMKFDTPNSKVDRTLHILFEGECDTDKIARVSVKTPWKKFGIEAALLNNEKEHSLTGKFINDGAEYMARLGLVVKSASGNTKVYAPTLELVFPEKKGKLAGKGAKGKKPTQPKGVVVEGTVTVERDEAAHKHIYTFDGVNFVTPKETVGLQGTVARDDEHTYSIDMKFKYDDLKEYLALKGKIHEQLSSGSVNDFAITTEVEFTSSAFTDFGFSTKWDLVKKPDHMESTFDLVHGSDLKSEVAHLHVSNLVLYKYESPDSFEVSTKNRVTYPLTGLDGKLEGAVSRTNVQYDMEFKYDKHKIESEMDFKFGKTLQEGYEFEWEVEAFGSGFELDSKREVTSPKNSKVEVCLELKPGGRKYELVSDLIHSYVGSREFEFGANTVLKIPGHENYRADGGIAVTPANFKTHIELHVGAVCHLDVSATGDLLSDGKCSSAQWKTMVKNHLEGSGHYSGDAKGDKLDFVVNLLKADRKLKGEFVQQHLGDGSCKVVFDFFWDADKDPQKKLHIESLNAIAKGSTLIDTKNTLVFEQKTTRFDLKMTKDGPLTSGTMTSVVDVYLSDGFHISGNTSHTIYLRPSSTGNSEIDLNLNYCATDPQKGANCIHLKSGVNHLNVESGSYDFNGEASIVDFEGKDMKLTVQGKSVPKGEKTEFDGKAFYGGSLHQHGPTVTVEWGGTLSKGAYTYHASGSIGDPSLEIKGSLDTTLDGGKTRLGEFHLEGHKVTPFINYFAVGQKAKITIESPKIFDFSSTTDLKWDKDNILIGAKANRHDDKGSALGTIRLPGQDEDHAVSAEWSHDAGTPRVEGSVGVMWPQGKQVKLELQATTPKDSLSLHLVAHTPVKGHEKMELLVNHRHLRADHALETDVTLVASPEHKTTIHSRVEYAEHRRTFDMTVSRQGGPTYKAFIRMEKKGDNVYEREVKLDWGGEENHFVGETSLKVNAIDDFALHGFIDCPALKVNKLSLDVATKQGGAKGAKGGGGGKRVVFTGKKGDEVIFQGSTGFSRKQDGNTVTYEGTGLLKMGDESKNVNFKASTTTLTVKDNGEAGLEGKMSIGMSSSKGEKYNVMGEGKATSKDFRLFHSFCKDSDKCSHMEVVSKVNFQDLEHDMDHEFAVIFDISNFVTLIPISMKGSTHRTGDFNLDHKFEVDLDKGKSKYSYHLYVKEHEAGASLTLPQRTMAVIGTLHGEGRGKKDGGLGGFNADVTMWLDKERHPELKTAISVLVDISESDKTYTVMSEGKLTHPSLEKPVAVRGQALIGGEHTWFDSRVEFDLFAKRDQMVIMCVKLHHEPVSGGGHNVTALLDLKSKGQNVDLEWVTHAAYTGKSFGAGSFASYLSPTNQRKDLGVLFRASPADVFLLVKVPSCELLRVDVKLDFSEAKQVITQEVCLFGTHTHIDQVEFKGLNSFKYHSFEKGSPNNQFQAHGTLVWGTAMELYVERLKEGQKEVMAHFTVALDKEHFFDVKHTWEQDKLKSYLSDVKNDLSHVVEEGKKMSDEMGAEAHADFKALLENLKNTAPNLKPLLTSYQTQLNELKEEILNDPVISQAVESVRKAVAAFAEALAQTIDKLTHMCEDLLEKWNALWQRVVEFYEKMAPVVQQSVSNVVAVIGKQLELFGHYAVEAFERFLEFMQQFSDEFKAVGKVIVQFLQDVARTIARLIDEVKHRYTELSQVAAEHLKAMPAFEYAKEMFNEFLAEFPQQLHAMFSEVLDALVESSPTPEVGQFFNGLKTYLLKKVDKVECNDVEELEALYNLFLKAATSVVELVRSQGHDYQLDFKTPMKFPFWPLGSSAKPLTLTFEDISHLPFFFAARFTPFFLRLDDFPKPTEILHELWPALPLGLFPPQNAYAVLVGGEHFFTFDHRHYTLSGCACSYILAQDFEDGNFSITAHLDEGKLKSVTLMDPKDIIVLHADNTVELNGVKTELPVEHGSLRAWAEFDSVSMKTDYGVRVTCDHHYKELCVVTVNGYYFGKTRGLLGTVNNEMHDDFQLPNGKVAPSVDKLANGWKVDPSCGLVSTQTHDHEHAQQCSEMFAGYSSMRACFPIVHPAGFREACDASVAMGTSEPCEMASAYVIACRQEGVDVSLPSKCAKCTVGGNPLDLGFTVSLKAPQGKADVVLVVEQVPENEAVFKNLVVPLVASLTNDLKAYKLTDVKFTLIGFGGHNQKWPSIFTVNGEVGFDGKGENVKFEVAKAEENKLLEDTPDVVKEYVRRFERLRKLVNVEIGNTNYAETFHLVREYPFRPGAARTVIAVLQSRCLYSPLPVSSQAVRLFFQKKQYELAGVTFHVITPLEFTAPSKEAKQMKQVVGVDKKGVFTLADAKKKFTDGDSQLRKEIKYDKDLCADFAVGTNGAAFSSHNFVEMPKPAFKKQFLQVVSQRVAQSLAPEFTEDCTCKLYNGLLPVTRCRVTSRKERENLKATKTVKG